MATWMQRVVLMMVDTGIEEKCNPSVGTVWRSDLTVLNTVIGRNNRFPSSNHQTVLFANA